MQFKATHRYARISPKKARLVADLIRGQGINDALQILRATPKRASYMLDKVLRSAIANADESLEADMEALRIMDCRVDRGPMLKRWRARARGQIGTIRKRTCHITVVLSDE